MTEIDLINDLQMSRQNVLQQFHRPSFDGLRHQCMIGIGAGSFGDIEGFVLMVNLRYRAINAIIRRPLMPDACHSIESQPETNEQEWGGMRRRWKSNLFGKSGEISPSRGCAAEFRMFEASNDIGKSRRNKKVFLFETKFFALHVLKTRMKIEWAEDEFRRTLSFG